MRSSSSEDVDEPEGRSCIFHIKRDTTSPVPCHLYRESPGVRLDLQPAGAFTSPDGRDIDTRFRAEDTALHATPAALARRAPVDAVRPKETLRVKLTVGFEERLQTV